MNRLDHPLFKERDFFEACKSVVGTCNNVSFEDRWEKETPDFTRAILQRVTAEKPHILDYGCGVGRMAKEVLEQSADATVVGVDASAVQLQHAREYVKISSNALRCVRAKSSEENLRPNGGSQDPEALAGEWHLGRRCRLRGHRCWEAEISECGTADRR